MLRQPHTAPGYWPPPPPPRAWWCQTCDQPNSMADRLCRTCFPMPPAGTNGGGGRGGGQEQRGPSRPASRPRRRSSQRRERPVAPEEAPPAATGSGQPDEEPAPAGASRPRERARRRSRRPASRSPDVTFEDTEGEGSEVENGPQEALGVLPALPEEARRHGSWIEPPVTAEALAEHRRNLRRSAIAAAKKIRASRALGLAAAALEGQEHEYAVLVTMIIVARGSRERI